jgi:hypothetical protein
MNNLRQVLIEIFLRHTYCIDLLPKSYEEQFQEKKEKTSENLPDFN